MEKIGQKKKLCEEEKKYASKMASENAFKKCFFLFKKTPFLSENIAKNLKLLDSVTKSV